MEWYTSLRTQTLQLTSLETWTAEVLDSDTLFKGLSRSTHC
jgi:hypothetical protein